MKGLVIVFLLIVLFVWTTLPAAHLGMFLHEMIGLEPMFEGQRLIWI